MSSDIYNLYHLLGIAENSSEKEIKEAHNAFDRCKKSLPPHISKALDLCESILLDANKRKTYDLKLNNSRNKKCKSENILENILSDIFTNGFNEIDFDDPDTVASMVTMNIKHDLDNPDNPPIIHYDECIYKPDENGKIKKTRRNGIGLHSLKSLEDTDSSNIETELPTKSMSRHTRRNSIKN